MYRLSIPQKRYLFDPEPLLIDRPDQVWVGAIADQQPRFVLALIPDGQQMDSSFGIRVLRHSDMLEEMSFTGAGQLSGFYPLTIHFNPCPSFDSQHKVRLPLESATKYV